MFLLGFTELCVKHIVNNGMKLNNNNDKKDKYLDLIFNGEKWTKIIWKPLGKIL